MEVDKIFKEIHDVYESHEGGAVYLSNNEVNKIKNLIRQELTVLTGNSGDNGVDICTDVSHKTAHSSTGFCSICQSTALILKH